jgi:uncharacterized protein YbjQ (UPF0145 family)
LAAAAPSAQAQGGHSGHAAHVHGSHSGHAAHVHGLVQANVAVQGTKLSVQIEAPLDSLLGFEHRPRTDAQRQAAQAVVQQLKAPATWLKPDAAAQCTLASSDVNSQALEPAKPGTKDAAHADLEASYEFNCGAPEKLKVLDITLMDTYKRIERITVQVAGAKAQSKQTLRRPAQQVRLAP